MWKASTQSNNVDYILLIFNIIWYMKYIHEIRTWNTYMKYISHREISPKFHRTKPKPVCTHHPPIDLEPNGRPLGSNQTDVRLAHNQSENGASNQTSTRSKKIPRRLLICTIASKNISHVRLLLISVIFSCFFIIIFDWNGILNSNGLIEKIWIGIYHISK